MRAICRVLLLSSRGTDSKEAMDSGIGVAVCPLVCIWSRRCASSVVPSVRSSTQQVSIAGLSWQWQRSSHFDLGPWPPAHGFCFAKTNYRPCTFEMVFDPPSQRIVRSIILDTYSGAWHFLYRDPADRDKVDPMVERSISPGSERSWSDLFSEEDGKLLAPIYLLPRINLFMNLATGKHM